MPSNSVTTAQTSSSLDPPHLLNSQGRSISEPHILYSTYIIEKLNETSKHFTKSLPNEPALRSQYLDLEGEFDVLLNYYWVVRGELIAAAYPQDAYPSQPNRVGNDKRWNGGKGLYEEVSIDAEDVRMERRRNQRRVIKRIYEDHKGEDSDD